MLNFSETIKLFRDNKIDAILSNKDGLRWLKLRSLSRKKYLEKMSLDVGTEIKGIKSDILFENLFFNHKVTDDYIDSFIKKEYQIERSARKDGQVNLVNDLYRIKSLDWGGFFQNNLDKRIIKDYVKKIAKYDELRNKIENDLFPRVDSYVESSWYSHWTSILLEDVFKDNKKVLPALGTIKSIDFFIDNFPVDLKTTYMPEGFIAEKRKNSGLESELQILKKSAKENDIVIDKNLTGNRLLEFLFKRLQDNLVTKVVVEELKNYRNLLVTDVKNNGEELIKWFYENQGEARFDSSNRLFLVLVNKKNYFESWKLKRGMDILLKDINLFLDNFSENDLYNIEFDWKKDKYNAKASIILIEHTPE